MEQKKFFGKNINVIVESILKNNGLKEDLKDYRDKKSKGIKPYFDILYKLINNFVLKSGTEASFLMDIQKELAVSEQMAKNILREVKKEILPLVITFSEDEIEEQNGTIPTSTQSVKKSIEYAIHPSQEPEKIDSGFKIDHPVPVKKKIIKEMEGIEKPLPTTQQQIKRGDTYREPIE